MSGAAADLLSPVAKALTVAVLHGLWQGTLIGAIGAGTLAAMQRCSARARYGVACLALVAMLFAFAATFSVALGDAVSSQQEPTRSESIKVDAVGQMADRAGFRPVSANTAPARPGWWPSITADWAQSIDGPALPFDRSWLAAAWLAGSAVVALSSIVQFSAVRRITASARFDIHDRWREAFEAVSHDLRLDRLARLGHSATVEVPTVVGWLAPIVLVPLGSCVALSTDEMRAILAHELAHIRRRDYLVNAVQKVVEAVLFFHPVTWWLSQRIRVEREYCCDDDAVRYANSALVYARALFQLETLRTQRHGYAMGADGGSLVNRIARIAGVKPERRRLSIIGGALGALVVAIIGTAFAIVGSANAEPAPPSPTPSAQGANGEKPGCDVVAAKLAQAVKDGRITQAQADEKLAGCGGPENSVAVGMTKLSCADVAAHLAEAVKAGEVTQQQADLKIAACNTPEPKVRSGTTKLSCGDVAAELADAVKSGKMSQEQADWKLAACTTPATTVTSGGATANCDAVAAKLAQAVKDGKITQAEATQKLASCTTLSTKIRSDCDAGNLAQAVKDGSITQERANQKLANCATPDQVQSCEGLAAQLQGLVAAGEATQEQIDRKLAGCTNSQPDTLSCADVAAHLAEAVKAGEITQADADVKIAACTPPAPK